MNSKLTTQNAEGAAAEKSTRQKTAKGARNAERNHNGHLIEYRDEKPLHAGYIASIYIDGRYEYDTLKNPTDALDAATQLCDQIDAFL